MTATQENKIKFISNELTALCKAIDTDISNMHYDNVDGEEYIVINTHSHNTIIVCITADSLSAIVTDTLRRIV